jgi:hypothetical protein
MPFAVGYLGSAVVIAIALALLDGLTGIVGGVIVVGAGVSIMVSLYWPGWNGPALRLWFVSVVANPVALFAAYSTLADYKCLLGLERGKECVLVLAFPMALGICLVLPLIGLFVRWNDRRGQA